MFVFSKFHVPDAHSQVLFKMSFNFHYVFAPNTFLSQCYSGYLEAIRLELNDHIHNLNFAMNHFINSECLQYHELEAIQVWEEKMLKSFTSMVLSAFQERLSITGYMGDASAPDV